MKYKKENGQIVIEKSEEFDVYKTLNCGQVFRWFENNGKFVVISTNKIAVLSETKSSIIITTNEVDYFERYFDLQTNYTLINKEIINNANAYLKNALEFGKGIRILKQNRFETTVSFIVSANNNIARIKKSLNAISKKFGQKLTAEHYAFPTHSELQKATEQDFIECGLGYRSAQLLKALKQFENFNIDSIETMPSDKAEIELIKLSGIGPKVADCVLQFAYNRQNVFIVDTWIEKAFFNLTGIKEKNRNIIRKKLTDTYKDLSGYVQQYLFYYKRSEEK